MKRTWKLLSFVSVLAFMLLAASGCKKDNELIEKVIFKPSDDLKFVRVSLVFTPRVQSDMAGGFDIKTYGTLFVKPYTETQRFEVGFDIDYAGIVNEQDYVDVQPTTTLPNGLPIGLPYPVVQISGGSPISSKFDLYGYADVTHQDWMGVAVMFSFLTDKYFPPSLSLSQVYLRDQAGIPRVMASVFGPKLNPDGSLQKNGGISLFANIKQLVKDVINKGPQTFYPESSAYVNGQNARRYSSPKAIRKLERSMIRALNEN